MIDAIQARTNSLLASERKAEFLENAFEIIKLTSLKGERSARIIDPFIPGDRWGYSPEDIDKIMFFRAVCDEITRQGFRVTIEKEGVLVIEW